MTGEGSERHSRDPAEMPTQVLMPALSPTMEEGKLAKWLVKEGDEVKSGMVIAEIETDKATMEVEAVDEGRLDRILVPEGTDNVKVNTPIAVILQDGEAPGAPAPGSPEAPRELKAADAQALPAQSRPAAPEGAEAQAPPQPAPVRGAGEVELPPDTEMMTQTMREALRDAMA